MASVFYKWCAGWDLPSISAACLQVEAYLRLARAEVSVQECSTAAASPSGQLPALDSGLDIVSTTGSDEYDAAHAIIQHLKSSGADLDQALEPSQQALCMAFSALIQLKLQPATLYATWCEPDSFTQHTRDCQCLSIMSSSGSSDELFYSRWQRHRQIRRVLHTLAAIKLESQSDGCARVLGLCIFEASRQVYAEAATAYAALAEHLGKQAQTNDGTSIFFFGDRPSSLDALLFGHLAMHLSSPIAPPQLQQKAACHPELVGFAERMSAHVFATPLPPAPPLGSPEWTARAESAASASAAARAAARARRQRQEKEEQMKRQGRWWLLSVAALMAGYVLFTGQYISFGTEQYEDEEVDDETD